MPNIFNLYQQYILTKDDTLLEQIVNSNYVHMIINNCYKINFNPNTSAFILERDEIISLAYIKLHNVLLDKHFEASAQLLTYIKIAVTGVIRDAARNVYKKEKEVMYMNNIEDYDTSEEDVYFTEEERARQKALMDFLKDHMYLYESVYNKLSIRQIAKKYNVTKWAVETKLKASKQAAAEFLADRQKE